MPWLRTWTVCGGAPASQQQRQPDPCAQVRPRPRSCQRDLVARTRNPARGPDRTPRPAPRDGSRRRDSINRLRNLGLRRLALRGARGRRADASEARDATGEPLFLFHERPGLRRLLLFPRPREFTGAVLPGYRRQTGARHASRRRGRALARAHRSPRSTGNGSALVPDRVGSTPTRKGRWCANVRVYTRNAAATAGSSPEPTGLMQTPSKPPSKQPGPPAALQDARSQTRN